LLSLNRSNTLAVMVIVVAVLVAVVVPVVAVAVPVADLALTELTLRHTNSFEEIA